MAKRLSNKTTIPSALPGSLSSPKSQRSTPTTSRRSDKPIKREQVAAACDSCRRRKTKCDALRPCTPCAKKGRSCEYETLTGETHLGALKRKYDEIERAHETYKKLVQEVATDSERNAIEVFRRLNRGQSPGSVLRSIEAGTATSKMSNQSRKVETAFLVRLATSTGSLKAITMLASDSSAKLDLLDTSDLRSLRDSIVHLPALENLVRRSRNRGVQLSALLNTDGTPGPWQDTRLVSTRPEIVGRVTEDYTNLKTPYQVPAVPWTKITYSSEAISHLISVFLAWLNPTWRFIVPDLFLRDMRSQAPQSGFCSSLLVNAICAIACLHTELDIAFAGMDRDTLTRGQHFHDEAMRLWVLECGRPSIVNVQALCILSLDSNYRAKDKLGLALVQSAVHLNGKLPMLSVEKQYAAQGFSENDLARARLSTHWTAECTHTIMSTAFLSDMRSDLRAILVPRIQDVFEDSTEQWIGYPLTEEPVCHKPRVYLQERCRLLALFRRMQDLIFAPIAEDEQGVHDFVKEVHLLASAMQQWHQELPTSLQYCWPMSVAVWELHASYLAFLMTLWVVARTRVQQELDSPDSPQSLRQSKFRAEMAADMLSRAIELAYLAAQNLSDFRERYGFNVSPAWLLQLQAVSAGVLLRDPELSIPPVTASPEARNTDDAISVSRMAFDEVFRSLLGASVQVTIARGIARMTYQTSQQQNISLSPQTRLLLRIMSKASWRPSDVSLFNSSFPNYATTKGQEDTERMTEVLSKWERFEL